MTTTFTDTNSLPRVKTPYGEMTEVLSQHLQGAKNVKGELQWLNDGQSLRAGADGRHELVYLMQGAGSIELEGKAYDVKKGNGLYLGPTETATITARGAEPLKLFHLVVPVIPS